MITGGLGPPRLPAIQQCFDLRCYARLLCLFDHHVTADWATGRLPYLYSAFTDFTAHTLVPPPRDSSCRAGEHDLILARKFSCCGCIRTICTIFFCAGHMPHEKSCMFGRAAPPLSRAGTKQGIQGYHLGASCLFACFRHSRTHGIALFTEFL